MNKNHGISINTLLNKEILLKVLVFKIFYINISFPWLYSIITKDFIERISKTIANKSLTWFTFCINFWKINMMKIIFVVFWFNGLFRAKRTAARKHFNNSPSARTGIIHRTRLICSSSLAKSSLGNIGSPFSSKT
jgi:hypothetical protein